MRALTISLLALCLCGCGTSTMKLTQDLPQNSSISTVATYQHKAIFFKKGYAGIGDSTYFHTVPKLNMNETIVSALNRELKAKGRYNVVYLPRASIPSSPAAEAEVISAGNKLSRYMIRYLKYVMNSRPVDYIVLVTPSIYTYDTSVGNSTTNNRLHNFGVVERNIIGVKWAFAYGSYQYYVINTHNWTVLGSTAGLFEQKVSTDIVKNDYRQIPEKVLDDVRRALQAQATSAVSKASHNVGLT